MVSGRFRRIPLGNNRTVTLFQLEGAPVDEDRRDAECAAFVDDLRKVAALLGAT